MVKTIIVTLTESPLLPDSALSATATVTISGIAYTGKVAGIVTHEAASVPKTIKLTGPGLTAE